MRRDVTPLEGPSPPSPRRPGEFYVAGGEMQPLLNRAPSLPDEAVTIHDVEHDPSPSVFGSLETHVEGWLRRHEADAIHPCHWVTFAILALVFVSCSAGWGITFHESQVRNPRPPVLPPSRCRHSPVQSSHLRSTPCSSHDHSSG